MKIDKEKLFLWCKKNHPDWTDEQIWIFVSLSISCHGVIESAGLDAVCSMDTLKAVIDKARKWLSENVSGEHEKAEGVFAEIMNNHSEWTKHGFKVSDDCYN